MKIYIVLHSDAERTGPFAGIDYVHGRGSTSSFQDAMQAVKCGCRIEDPADDALARCELGLRVGDEAATKAARAEEERKFGEVLAAEHLRKRG